MTGKLWTYFLGGTVVDQRVISGVQGYEDNARKLFGKETITRNERHLTIAPPFLASYETASNINIGCMMATIMTNHPLTKTRFSIQALDIMAFEGLEILCFPVEIQADTKEEKAFFVQYVKELRLKLLEYGIQYKEKIPAEYKPHITVFVGENLSNNEGVQSLIHQSKGDTPRRFRSGYPTLYTKTTEGWGDLSYDPNP